MMNRTKKAVFAIAVLLVAVLAGCAITKKNQQSKMDDDISRIVTLPDGTTCMEPAGLADSREKPGAIQLRELLKSDVTTVDAVAKATALKLQPDEAEAVYFDACRAYAKGTIQKDEFEANRTVYVALRGKFTVEGVKEWQDKKDGIADPGKLCLVSLPDTDPDHRSFTRVVPANSSVSDCAELAVMNGSREILLGCTKGHWENTWAKKPISLGTAGTAVKQLTAKGTALAPDPDCGWN
ncbi:MAG TPA: hypothetical protein VN496_10000 [Burkholderiales bacterium]|nr:hypothetical protein [Burkholderiales bacterium]